MVVALWIGGGPRSHDQMAVHRFCRRSHRLRSLAFRCAEGGDVRTLDRQGGSHQDAPSMDVPLAARRGGPADHGGVVHSQLGSPIGVYAGLLAAGHLLVAGGRHVVRTLQDTGSGHQSTQCHDDRCDPSLGLVFAQSRLLRPVRLRGLWGHQHSGQGAQLPGSYVLRPLLEHDADRATRSATVRRPPGSYGSIAALRSQERLVGVAVEEGQ